MKSTISPLGSGSMANRNNAHEANKHRTWAAIGITALAITLVFLTAGFTLSIIPSRHFVRKAIRMPAVSDEWADTSNAEVTYAICPSVEWAKEVVKTSRVNRLDFFEAEMTTRNSIIVEVPCTMSRNLFGVVADIECPKGAIVKFVRGSKMLLIPCEVLPLIDE